jgi:hypothetical protein
MFSKQHYEAIAQVMQNAHPGRGLSADNAGGDYPCAVRQWSETCKDFAEMLEKDNPHFDITRFMHACR